MKEVTDALLIMVLVLKSVMSSLLYNVSTNIYFMIHCDLEWIMVLPVKAVNMSSDGHLFCDTKDIHLLYLMSLTVPKLFIHLIIFQYFILRLIRMITFIT